MQISLFETKSALKMKSGVKSRGKNYSGKRARIAYVILTVNKKTLRWRHEVEISEKFSLLSLTPEKKQFAERKDCLLI
jgi:hypothetical protein